MDFITNHYLSKALDAVLWQNMAFILTEMFEISERAGIAGNDQWGLDAGDNQYWYPYESLWHTGEREEDEEETRVS